MGHDYVGTKYGAANGASCHEIHRWKQARANALIGVFISVTTIPAAASVGVSIAFSSWTEAWGSALQLLLNVVVLVVVGATGLTAQRRIWRWRGSPPDR